MFSVWMAGTIKNTIVPFQRYCKWHKFPYTSEEISSPPMGYNPTFENHYRESDVIQIICNQSNNHIFSL
jgi:hypothetical protein